MTLSLALLLYKKRNSKISRWTDRMFISLPVTTSTKVLICVVNLAFQQSTEYTQKISIKSKKSAIAFYTVECFSPTISYKPFALTIFSSVSIFSIVDIFWWLRLNSYCYWLVKFFSVLLYDLQSFHQPLSHSKAN